MANLLKKYQQMRDFEDTPEPSGRKRVAPKKKPIFVVQKHAASHLHYDFRLEMEGVLKSWAVPKGPSYDPAVRRLAMMTEDHPYDYAGFEGVIPEGNYGAGNVIIWDNGYWEFIEPGDDPVKALQQGKLTFRLQGKKLFGEWALVRIRSKSGKDNEWLLLKHRDKFASDEIDVTEVAPRSIISDRDVDDLAPERVWESNRKATRRGARTLADRLREEEENPKRASAPSPPKARSSAGASALGGAKRAAKAKSAAKRTSPAKSASSRKSSATKQPATAKKVASSKKKRASSRAASSDR